MIRPRVPDHTYLSTLLDCPRAFYHKYVEHLDSKGEPLRLLAGSAMHKGLEVIHAGGETGDAIAAMAEEYGEARPMGDLDFLTVGHLETVLRNYVDHWEDRDPFTVVEMIEEPIVETIGGHEVGGIPDIVVEQDGELIVLDHKTTTSYIGSHLYNRVKFSKQFPIYCLLISEKLGRPVRRAICNAVYTGKYAAREKSKATKFERWSFEYSEEDLEETQEWLYRTISQAEAIHEYKDSSLPQHGGSHCGWCDFKSLCEVAPPLRSAIKDRSFRVRERTGILLSGADE